MTDTEQLIASLIASTPDTTGMYLSEDSADGYFDWSSQDEDGVVTMEVGDLDGNTASVDLTRDQMEDLHRRLTLWLLQNPA